MGHAAKLHARSRPADDPAHQVPRHNAVLDVLRRSDPAADAAWKEREHARLQRCQQLMRRLHAEEELGPGWDVSSAARCFWAVTSQRVWDDLVIDQGWTTARYRKHITALLEAALLRPT